MWLLLPVLFGAVFTFAEGPQAFAPAAPISDNLRIPARLSRTVDTKKCKAGDAVELKTVEPVLVGNGLVMPENARLHGRIVGAASRQKDKPSWLVLVVERAEWKDHSLPLHAFVISQITMRTQVAGQSDNTFEKVINLPDNVQRRRFPRQVPQSNPGSSGLSTEMTHPPRDATVDASEAWQLNYHGVEDLHLLKNQSGTIFLVSNKSHLKLPSGAMFMLRNTPGHESVDAANVGGSKQ